jgi:hypothetical protein
MLGKPCPARLAARQSSPRLVTAGTHETARIQASPRLRPPAHALPCLQASSATAGVSWDRSPLPGDPMRSLLPLSFVVRFSECLARVSGTCLAHDRLRGSAFTLNVRGMCPIFCPRRDIGELMMARQNICSRGEATGQADPLRVITMPAIAHALGIHVATTGTCIARSACPSVPSRDSAPTTEIVIILP